MKIRVTNDAVTVTLSQANVRELAALVELANVNTERRRMESSRPMIFKQFDGEMWTVRVEPDNIHYAERSTA